MEIEALHDALVSQLRSLRRYALALVGNATEADELVQETLAKALSRAQSWQEVRDVRAYLFAILHNLHRDGIARRRRASVETPLETVEVFVPLPPAQDDRLALRDLARAFGRLSDDQRSVILLVSLEGMSYQEVSEVLGIPLGTVMSRLNRGRRALRALLADRAPPHRPRQSYAR